MEKHLIEISDFESFSPVFRGKAGNRLAKAMLDLFGVAKLDRYYNDLQEYRGAEAAGALLKELGVAYSFYGEDHLKDLPAGPFITISNHPIGSLDGIALIDYFGHLFRDYKFLVNKFLSRVENLTDSFITVIPTGEKRTGPTVESIGGIREAMAHIRDGHPLGLFPSGAISDLEKGEPLLTLPDGTGYREPRIRDREWQLPMIKFIKWAKVPVVPIRIFDGNSALFYWLEANLGWKVRTLRFPHEVLNKRGKTIRMGIGPVISPETQEDCSSLEELRHLLRGAVYSQKLP